MSLCDTCDITEKLYQCCGRHPFTGEQVSLVLNDGTTVLACPFLDENARCSIYDNRPQGCRNFRCESMLRNDSMASSGDSMVYDYLRSQE